MSFLMPVEDVFSVPGRGTVVTGRIERGVVGAGDKIEIVGIRETAKATCIGVEQFRKQLDEARAGQNVGIRLGGKMKDEVEHGQVLAKPGSISSYTKFEAFIWFLPEEQSGYRAAFFDRHRLKFGFHGVDVPGRLNFPQDVEMVIPGDTLKLTVDLDFPIALEEGLRFWVGKWRSLGAGLVTRIFARKQVHEDLNWSDV